MHDSGASRRESANARLGVIARSEATKQSILSSRGEMDCFASLAMTAPHLDRLCCLKLEPRHCEERSDEAIHTFFCARWIASRSLSSGAHSRDPLARSDGLNVQFAGRGISG